MNKAFKTAVKPENRELAEFQQAFMPEDSPSTERLFPDLEMMSPVDAHPSSEGIVQRNCLHKLFKGTFRNAL
jgi:hypothetical protein